MKTTPVVLAILLVGVGLGITYHFENRRNDSIAILEMKAKCAQDGKEFLAQRFQVPPPYALFKEFNYASDLQTCLAHVEYSIHDVGVFHVIYDIYKEQPIAQYDLHPPNSGIASGSDDDRRKFYAAKQKYFPE
jgi:hypothetical protein